MESPKTIAKPLENPSAIPLIQVTNDYSLLKFMGGNRSIDYAHVQRLKNEMKDNLRIAPGCSNPRERGSVHRRRPAQVRGC